MLRTHTCGELTEKQAGTSVTLCGWVNTRRDHGGLIFIDLRDRYGLTQIVCHPEKSKEAFAMSLPVIDEGTHQGEEHDALDTENDATGSSKVELAKLQGYTGSMCSGCGSNKMKRNGSCELCLDCGQTSGCS